MIFICILTRFYGVNDEIIEQGMTMAVHTLGKSIENEKSIVTIFMGTNRETRAIWKWVFDQRNRKCATHIHTHKPLSIITKFLANPFKTVFSHRVMNNFVIAFIIFIFQQIIIDWCAVIALMYGPPINLKQDKWHPGHIETIQISRLSLKNLSNYDKNDACHITASWPVAIVCICFD